MGKPKEIEVRSLNDFHELVEKKYFGISEAIVLDITLEKVNFKETLKENLKYFEQREMYEECGKIHKAIEVLSKSEK